MIFHPRLRRREGLRRLHPARVWRRRVSCHVLWEVSRGASILQYGIDVFGREAGFINYLFYQLIAGGVSIMPASPCAQYERCRLSRIEHCPSCRVGVLTHSNTWCHACPIPLAGPDDPRHPRPTRAALLGGLKTTVQPTGPIWQLIGSKEQDAQRAI